MLREATRNNARLLFVSEPDASEQAQVANAPTATDDDAINFNIPATGVQTINPTSTFDPINDPVTINGFSQTGATPNMHTWTYGVEKPDPPSCDLAAGFWST